MTKRLLEFSSDAAERIADLQERLKCQDPADVLCKALSLLNNAVEHVDEGGYIFFKKPDGRVERIIL